MDDGHVRCTECGEPYLGIHRCILKERQPLTMNAKEEKQIREALLLDGPLRHAARKIIDELEAERAMRRATVGEIAAWIRDNCGPLMRAAADYIEKTWGRR